MMWRVVSQFNIKNSWMSWAWYWPETLPLQRHTDHVLDLQSGYKLSSRGIYNHSTFELRTLKTYIATNVASGFIQRLSTSATGPIVYSKKKPRWLQLCVNYQALNLGREENTQPLHLISELIDRMCEDQIFTQLDLLKPHHLLRIQEGEQF